VCEKEGETCWEESLPVCVKKKGSLLGREPPCVCVGRGDTAGKRASLPVYE